MTRMRLAAAVAASLAAACLVAPASAQTFSGTGDPAASPVFTGPTRQATFTTLNQIFTSYTEAGVTISAGRITNSYNDDYNTFGSSYDNNAGRTPVIDIAFAAPTSAFAFNWGAADVLWTIDLFSSGSLLGSYSLPATSFDNDKAYFGFTGLDITSARLTSSDFAFQDFVFIDNLTYGSADVGGVVPEPATWAMMIGGFGLAGGALRRRRTGPVARLA